MKGTIVRELARTAAAIAIAAFATAPGVSQAQNQDVSGEITLMAYAGIFEDQYKQAVIEPFLEEYPNVSINYFTTGNSAQMLGALRAQKSDPQVDVAIFDAGVALVGNAEGLLSEISVDEVPNLADLHPLATVQEGYGPAVTFDNLVIIYDTQDVEGSPTSLAELWNEEYDGAVGVSAMPNIQGIALTAMTASMIGEDWTKSIDGAIEKLAELAPRVQTFDPQPDGYTMVLNDSLVIATGWNARAQTFREQSDGRLGVMLPDEGSVFQINAINLVEGAKNKPAALAFINYALSPEAQKRFTEAMYYAPVNTKAEIDPAALEKTALARMDEMLPLDWAWVAGIRDEWNERWRREVIAAGG